MTQEINQEIPRNTPNELLDRKLKKDSLDATPYFDKKRANWLLLQIVPGIVTTLSGKGLEHFVPPNSGLPAAIAVTGATYLTMVSFFELRDHTQLYLQTRKAQKIEKIHSISDEQLGYRADRCVYQGKQPIEVGDQKFKKGDNFYFIQLPAMPQGITESPETLDAWTELYDCSLKEIKERLTDKNYQFVAIDANLFSAASQSLELAQSLSRKEVFAGKKDKTIKEEEKQCFLLTKEDFDELTASPQGTFDKLAHALGDEEFLHFISLAKQAKTQREKANAKDLVQRRLNQVLLREIETQFNSTPEVAIKLDSSHTPRRQKIYTRTLIRKTEKGVFLVKINDANGEMQWTLLDNLLKTKDQPIEEILDSTRPIKKAQIAYILYKILSETELDELIKEPIQSREDIVEKLKACGINIQEPDQRVSDLVKKKFFPPGRFGKIRPFLAPALIFASSLLSLSALTGNQHIIETTVNPISIERAIDKSEIGFGLPPTGLDWKVEGTMPLDGYYITKTSHTFEDRHWEKNDKIKRPLELPRAKELQQNDPYLTLSKIIPAGLLGYTEFKIPIREKTKVAAINIVDPDGQDIEFSTYEITDGTIQVNIINGFNNPAWVSVKATLAPTSQNSIYASERLEPLNTQELSEEAKNILENAARQSPDNPSQALFEQIKQDHEYSFDPPNKEKLEDAQTPEEILNAVVELEGCNCIVCNTAAVLISSTQNQTNAAFGYIAMDNHPAGASSRGFLRSETSQTFGVNEKGEILDATPSKIASDWQTEAYIYFLHRPTSYENTLEQWDQQQEGIRSRGLQTKKIIDTIKMLGVLVTTATSWFSLYQAVRIAKRFGTKENFSALLDNIITRTLTPQDITKAYDFFGWLSWGNQQPLKPSRQSVNFSNKKEVLEQMRKNINYEKLAQYLETPRAFERLANGKEGMITFADSPKLRLLARYLLT